MLRGFQRGFLQKEEVMHPGSEAEPQLVFKQSITRDTQLLEITPNPKPSTQTRDTELAENHPKPETLDLWGVTSVEMASACPFLAATCIAVSPSLALRDSVERVRTHLEKCPRKQASKSPRGSIER